MNIYFRLSGLQSSFLFIHFSEGPNTCLHRTIVWHRSYSICRRSTFQMDRAQLRAEIPVGVCELKPYPV